MDKKKKLPRMYTSQDSDREQIRQADETSVASADPFLSADYVEQDPDLLPVNGGGKKLLLTTKLRKRGKPQ